MPRFVTRQDARKIEAEAINIQGISPVAQAVGNQLTNGRMCGAQIVTASAVIDELRIVRGIEQIVSGVVDATKAVVRDLTDCLR